MGTVLTSCQLGKFVDTILDGDPFGTYLLADRIVFADAYDLDHPLVRARKNYRRGNRPHPTHINEGTTRDMATPKELRKECKALDIEGWEDMSAKEMAAAIKAAKKSGSKKSSKKDKSTKSEKSSSKSDKGKKDSKKSSKKGEDREVAENGNPYPPGSNLFEITEELLKGGKRSKMVSRLSKKITLRPRDGRELDEDAELDRRVLITAQILERDHGFSKEKDGRGSDASIQVFPPKGKK